MGKVVYNACFGGFGLSEAAVKRLKELGAPADTYKMKFKKETKHTVVYETDDVTAPVESVYVSKLWLLQQGVDYSKAWPQEIELEVKVLA